MSADIARIETLQQELQEFECDKQDHLFHIAELDRLCQPKKIGMGFPCQ